ncbi:uncharacterized protein I303_103045 [Kwoniella dejecticola CBS 10117]|uniref:Uncharacterized protein n=1 Tax=Kwoniella dejecticola CBS 10117 TaxID=1296121 RepID=A0A1A6AAF2_9TREE|nr:uncharacterized protein I303_03065 [Kwoniella dejecticola CBS 10117]OBR87042.1 hypothetical protein I303_03065 [Kwoniella dejecticola CBS 10117]
MVSYSSSQLQKEFIYTPLKDYVTPEGHSSATYAPGHPLSFGNGKGSELRFVPFEKRASKRSYGPIWTFNCDYTIFALGIEDELHVYHLNELSSPSTSTTTAAKASVEVVKAEIEERESERGRDADTIEPPRCKHQILRGHTGQIGFVAFLPHNPKKMVSYAESRSRETSRIQRPSSEIIFWDLDEVDEGSSSSNSDNDVVEASVQGVKAIREYIWSRSDSTASPGCATSTPSTFTLNMDFEKELAESIHKILSRAKIDQLIPKESKMNGRLTNQFGSPIFDHKGTQMIYMPGDRPCSNGDDKWDFIVLDLQSRQEWRYEGHRDSIMRIGFSPNDKLIASVAWDKSIKIWNAPHTATASKTGAGAGVDAEKGDIVYDFKTEGQNWAGVWSPDSRFFLGTCGQGAIRIWDIANGNGEEVWKFQYGEWCRAVDWSKDGKYIALGGRRAGSLMIFNVEGLAGPSGGSPGITSAEEEKHKETKTKTKTQTEMIKSQRPSNDDDNENEHGNGRNQILDTNREQNPHLTDAQDDYHTANTKIKLAFERSLEADFTKEELRPLASGMMGVHVLSFLPVLGSGSGSQGPKLVSTTSGENAIEVFDIATQQKWRFVDPKREDLGTLKGWQWDEERGHLITIHGDGLRYWKF